MVTEVLVFAAAVVVAASADVVLSPTGFSNTQGLVYPPFVVPTRPPIRHLRATTSEQADEDPFVTIVRSIYNKFIKTQEIMPNDQYIYAYEAFDWKTRLNTGLYESRFNDTSVGTSYKVTPEGIRTTVEYTVDPTHGFQASVRTDVQNQPSLHGYSSKAGPLAYASSPNSEEDGSHELLTDKKTNNTHAQSAHRTHNIVVEHLQLTAPFNLTWGYEVRNTESRHIRSQYESYQQDTAEGRYVEGEADGSRLGLYYSIHGQEFTINSLIGTQKAVAAPI